MTTRVMIEHLPEAGKPDGLCPECGPHGNLGVVTLLYSVVPCLECGYRADETALGHAHALIDALRHDLLEDGIEARNPSYEIRPKGTRGRVVVASVEY